MSEDREPRDRQIRPPENVHLYVAPGMNTVSFADLMIGFGVRRDLAEQLEGLTGQIATLTNALTELKEQVEGIRQQHEAEPVAAPTREGPSRRR